MAKLARKMFAQFFSFGEPGTGPWSVLGHDTDDLSAELNPDTSTEKNVLGENAFRHNGYEPEVAMDTYYADPDDPIYETILDIAMNRDNSEEKCLGYYAEVVFDTYDDNTKQASGTAWIQRAWAIPQSLGGDTAGFNIPFNVNPIGVRTKWDVSYNATTYTPTFTAIS